MLYDMEFLEDSNGRRVAAFGYYAGQSISSATASSSHDAKRLLHLGYAGAALVKASLS